MIGETALICGCTDEICEICKTAYQHILIKMDDGKGHGFCQGCIRKAVGAAMPTTTIEVTYDGVGHFERYPSLEAAKEGILAAHANGVGVDNVEELDAAGKVVRQYGCSWNVELEEI